MIEHFGLSRIPRKNFRGTLAHNIVNIVYYFYVNFLHLRVTQKALQLPFLFFLFFLTVTDFAYISSFVMQDDVTRIRLMSLDALANVFVKATVIVKFWMCEYDIPCALEKIVIADLSTLVTWSFKIMWQTKTISSLLAQGLRPRELLRWWVTWAPAHEVTWPFDPVILPNLVTNLNPYIFSTAVSKATKLSRRALAHKVTWAFDHVVFQDHKTN